MSIFEINLGKISQKLSTKIFLCSLTMLKIVGAYLDIYTICFIFPQPFTLLKMSVNILEQPDYLN